MKATEREELAQNILAFAKLTTIEKRLKFLQKHLNESKLINQLDFLYFDEMKGATDNLVDGLLKQDKRLHSDTTSKSLLTNNRLKTDKEEEHTLSKTAFEFQHVFHLLGRIDGVDSFTVKGHWDLLSPYIKIEQSNISPQHIQNKLLSINNKINDSENIGIQSSTYTDTQKKANIKYRNAWIDLLGLLDNSRKTLPAKEQHRYEDINKYFVEPFVNGQVLVDTLQDQNITDSIEKTKHRVFADSEDNELATDIQGKVFEMLKQDNIKSKSFLGVATYYTESELIDLLFDRQLDVKSTVDELTQENIEDTRSIEQNKRNNDNSQQNQEEIVQLICEHQQLIIREWVRELNNVITLLSHDTSLISNFTVKGYKYVDDSIKNDDKTVLYDFDNSEIKLTLAKVNKLLPHFEVSKPVVKESTAHKPTTSHMVKSSHSATNSSSSNSSNHSTNSSESSLSKPVTFSKSNDRTNTYQLTK